MEFNVGKNEIRYYDWGWVSITWGKYHEEDFK